MGSRFREERKVIFGKLLKLLGSLPLIFLFRMCFPWSWLCIDLMKNEVQLQFLRQEKYLTGTEVSSYGTLDHSRSVAALITL